MKQNRIVICGISGAGKSTLARTLSQKYGHEIIHLDSIFWDKNWKKREDSEFFGDLENSLKKERWIFEGSILRALEKSIDKADLVIWLKPNRFIAIFRIIKRFMKFRGRTRPEMPEGCHEAIDFDFLRWIWSYPENKYESISRLLSETSVKVIVVESKNDLNRLYND